jgi:hypothetical protein
MDESHHSNVQPRLTTTSSFCILVQASGLLTRVQPVHIPGKENVELDALSRLQNGWLRKWEDLISRCSLLRTCKICLLPPVLLVTLAELSLCKQTVDTYNAGSSKLICLPQTDLVIPVTGR